jgi:hypothetical protein
VRAINFLLENKKLLGVLAWIGLVGTMYFSLFYTKSTEITFEQLSDNYVVEIKEKLSKLDVLYDGKSLKESGQALRVVNMRIVNSGENNIRIGDYDPNLPIGFSVDRGEIIELPQIVANKSYLSKALNPKLISTTSVSFSPAILEPKDYFQISAMILVSDPLPPKIIPYGAIAGSASEAPVFKSLSDTKDTEGLFQRAIDGDWRIHAIRAPIYSVVFFLAILSFAAVTSIPRDIIFYREDVRIRHKRISIVNKYIFDHGLKYDRVSDYIFTEFTDRKYFSEGGSGDKFEDLTDLKKLIEKSKQKSNDGEVIYSDGNQLTPTDRGRLELVIKACGFAPGVGEDMFLSLIDDRLSHFIDYLNKNNHLISYSMRDESGISLFPFNPYSGKPNFQWVP